jgi:TRAP-type mannitol/chloroaromatic compound transport system permease small subunit
MTQRIGVVAYWLLPIMVLVSVWNVVGRYFGQWIGINLASNVLIESQWYLFSIIFLLGAPYALLHNEHVRVDVLYARMPDRRRAIINILGTTLFLLPFCIFIIYFSLSFVEASWRILEDSPDPGGIPRYPIKTLIPVAMILLFVQGVSELIKNTAALTGHLPARAEETPAADHDEAASHETQAIFTDQDARAEKEPLYAEGVAPDTEQVLEPDEHQQQDEHPPHTTQNEQAEHTQEKPS